MGQQEPKPQDPPTPPAPEPGGGQQEEFRAITSQEQLDRIIGERLARERGKYAGYDDLKAKAAKFDEIENQNKTELQKALERAEAAEKAAKQAVREKLQREIADELGLPVKLASRLKGDTADEMRADGAEIAADLGVAKPSAQTQPSERMRRFSGGGDPTEEPVELDPAKLAAGIPR